MAAHRRRRARIVYRVCHRIDRQQGGEIAVPFGLRRHGEIGRVGIGLDVGDLVVLEEEKELVLSVIDLGNAHRPADGESRLAQFPGRLLGRARLDGAIGDSRLVRQSREMRGAVPSVILRLIEPRSMVRIVAGFRGHADVHSGGMAQRGVKRRCLDAYLPHRLRGRHEPRAPAIGSGDRSAVQQELVARAHAAVGVVAGGPGVIEHPRDSRRPREHDTGRNGLQGKRVHGGVGQLRDLAIVQHAAARGAGGL